MERLVIKSKAGSLYYNDTQKDIKLEPHEITPHQRRLLLERLYAYEDTGLTQEQIRKLKERDTAKNPVPSQFKSEMVCPVCGSTAYPWNTFCDECGQRLWDDEKP